VQADPTRELLPEEPLDDSLAALTPRLSAEV
jgi:hypothetical protein